MTLGAIKTIMPCVEGDRSDWQPSTTTTALSLRLLYVKNVKSVLFKADNNEEKIRHLVKELEKRDVKIASLADEGDDLRNRGMRKTIIVRGFPEGIEGKDSWENVRACVPSFLEKQGLPEIEIDRAHRSAKKITPTGSQSLASNRQKPRPVFCELLTWQDANQILRKASAH